MSSKIISITDKEREKLLSLSIPATLRKKIESGVKPKSARYGKNKGASFQKWVAGKIADLFNIEWDNTDDNSPIQTRSMGLSGKDIILREPVSSLFPWDIECKNVEKLAVISAIEQATKNKTTGRDWLLVWKNKKFSQPVVIMEWEALAKFYKK